MSDHIIRGMAANNQVRFFAGTTRDIVETARSIHNTSPVATAALGRLLTAGALMGAQCKNESDVLTLQIQCNGPIGGLTVTADAHSRVKGYVNNPNVILHANDKGKLDVAKALDLGVLSVIKDIGLKEPYVGQTQLVSGEIAEDLTYTLRHLSRFLHLLPLVFSWRRTTPSNRQAASSYSLCHLHRMSS